MTSRAAAIQGAKDMLPILLGGVPFGLIAGVSAASIDFGPLEAVTISGVVFAGAAQLASYDLLGQSAPAIIVFMTAVVINLRFAIYSAAIAPTFAKEKAHVRLLCAFLLTDQGYALTAGREDKEHSVPYFLGASISLFFMWTSTTAVGAILGASIPASWSLDFAVPLCFVALLAPAIRDRRQLIVAGVTAAAALLFASAPHKSGVILSILAGIAAGALLDRMART